jgi:hypothetical protein
MRPPIAGLLAAAVCAGVPAIASAQYVSRDVPRAGAVELGVSAAGIGGRDAGSAVATETSNPTVSENPLPLFRADSRVKPVIGVEGQIGVYVSRAFELEGTVSFSRPVLSARLTGDLEGAPDTIAEETLTQYLIGGSALYHFGRGRLRPVVFGGAGYLRQLDAGPPRCRTAPSCTPAAASSTCLAPAGGAPVSDSTRASRPATAAPASIPRSAPRSPSSPPACS